METHQWVTIVVHYCCSLDALPHGEVKWGILCISKI